MKVRHKRPPHHEVFDVRYSFEHDGLSWYLLVGPNETPWAALQSDYEPVPSETWRDVTAECQASEIPRILDLEGYRLRKVHVFPGPMKSDLADGQCAFIVEKKES